MRYRLRTLLIGMAIVPPILAVAWMIGRGDPVNPALIAVATYLGLVATLVVASWIVEVTRGFGLSKNLRFKGRCSFCGQSYRDVGPLAEGPDYVYICCSCIEACYKLIEDERKRPK